MMISGLWICASTLDYYKMTMSVPFPINNGIRITSSIALKTDNPNYDTTIHEPPIDSQRNRTGHNP
jgi:hypothetical protein